MPSIFLNQWCLCYQLDLENKLQWNLSQTCKILPQQNAFEFVVCKMASIMISSNGNIFRITGPLCGEFTGHRRISLTKSMTRSFNVFFDLRLNEQLRKQSIHRWFETPSRSLSCHCNVVLSPRCATCITFHIYILSYVCERTMYFAALECLCLYPMTQWPVRFQSTWPNHICI